MTTHPKYIVTAASISRIIRHFGGDVIDEGVMILSADRSDRSLVGQENAKLNNRAQKRLESLLKSKGLGGWIKAKGAYVENPGAGPSYEKSYIVPRVSKDEAKAIARLVGKNSNLSDRDKNPKAFAEDFRQDSILWGNTKNGLYLFYHDGREELLGRKFDFQKIGQYYTQWHNKRFAISSVLDSIEVVPQHPDEYRSWRSDLLEASTNYVDSAEAALNFLQTSKEDS